ncbi:MAG: hypothetical protein AAB727_02800 [Patescibacteria group bacterium]
MNPLRVTFPPENFLLIITVLLFSYKGWKIALHQAQEQKNAAVEKSATSAVTLTKHAAKVFLGDLHRDRSFMNSLEEYCKVYKLDLDPKRLISDILSDRDTMEHPETN